MFCKIQPVTCLYPDIFNYDSFRLRISLGSGVTVHPETYIQHKINSETKLLSWKHKPISKR